MKRFDSAAAISTTANEVYVRLVRGVLNFGDPQKLFVRKRDRSWISVADVRPLVGIEHQSAITLAPSDSVRIGLRFYGLKR